MNDERLKSMIRDAMPRFTVAPRDLWPAMQERLQRNRPRVSRLDWALIAAVVASFLVFPEGVIAVLFHL